MDQTELARFGLLAHRVFVIAFALYVFFHLFCLVLIPFDMHFPDFGFSRSQPDERASKSKPICI